MLEPINTLMQLNKFSERANLTTPAEIINRLADKKIVINHKLAKLVLLRDSREIRTCFQPIF